MFAFRLRRIGNADHLEGASLRYTAMALIGLSGESDVTVRDVLDGQSMHDVCTGMTERLDSIVNLGDVAALLWAAVELNHPHTGRILDGMMALDPTSMRHPTVERAWALTALSIDPNCITGPALAEQLAIGLKSSFDSISGIFSHQGGTRRRAILRAHVACFADLVYPTIALSHYGVAFDDDEAKSCARACAGKMCDMQGPSGQWWWHFDTRTGQVIEEYPVYAVHQDAMAPMALFAAEQACHADFGHSIRRGVDWLTHAPEINGSLIDPEADLIWRKVARREPNKLSRSVKAALSAVRSGWQAPILSSLFRPVRIDYESRPYHMGWILYAWPTQRIEEFATRWKGKAHESHTFAVADAPSV